MNPIMKTLILQTCVAASISALSVGASAAPVPILESVACEATQVAMKIVRASPFRGSAHLPC